MKRLMSYNYNYFIGKAFDVVPGRITEKIAHVDFVVGVDPCSIGLYSGKYIMHISGFTGERYADYPHYIDTDLQTKLPRAMRNDTIYLPHLPNLLKKGWKTECITETIVHELGHVLHTAVDYDFSFPAVSEYAQTDHYEAFAEAFCSWLLPELYPWVGKDLKSEIDAKFRYV